MANVPSQFHRHPDTFFKMLQRLNNIIRFFRDTVEKMPFRCCVPKCKGNYPTGQKVATFTFPKNEDLKRQWIVAIQRDFTPTPCSKVCELHFQPADFVTESSAIDDKTGQVIVAKLKIKRLKNGAVPSLFENYPPSAKRPAPVTRPSPNSKRQNRDERNLEKVLAESVVTKRLYDNERSVKSIKDIIKCAHSLLLQGYHLIGGVGSTL